MEQLAKLFLFGVSLVAMPFWSQNTTAIQYFIPTADLKNCCHLNLEVASKEAQENGKNILAFIYQSQDSVIENFLTGAAEKVLKQLSNEFTFYSLDIQSGLLPSCSEKRFILEQLNITRLPTILILNPSTSKVCKRIERPKEGALSEELLMKKLENLLKDSSVKKNISIS